MVSWTLSPPRADQHVTSPFNNTTWCNIHVTRIKELITEDEVLTFKQTLPTCTIWNVENSEENTPCGYCGLKGSRGHVMGSFTLLHQNILECSKMTHSQISSYFLKRLNNKLPSVGNVSETRQWLDKIGPFLKVVIHFHPSHPQPNHFTVPVKHYSKLFL